MPSQSLLSAALLSVLALAAALTGNATAAETPMSLSMVRGGTLGADAVADGPLVYLPTGRVLATWDYTSTVAPLRIATTAPSEGVINGLTRTASHLYASWRGYDGSSGVTAYSLANPRQPTLVSETTYPASGEKYAAGVAAANGHLYVFDQDHGVFVANLADPARPVFTATPMTGPLAQYSKVVARGNRIFATGRTFGGQTVMNVFDVANPLSPVLAGSSALDGFSNFSLFTDGNTFMGVGTALTTYELDAASQLVPRGSTEIPYALAGARVGNNIATFGIDRGLNLWTAIGNMAPLARGRIDVSTLGARRSVTSNSLLLVPTENDLMQAFLMPKAARPRHLSTSWMPGGVAASDIAMHNGQPLMLQANYGFTISDAQTLAPLTRFDADLPETLQERDFEQMAVSGDTAYLTAWGYGLITVDLSTGTPKELGRTALVFASVIDVQGDYAYVAKWTNGGLLATVDVSDPANPTPVWQIGLASQPYRVKVSGGHAYLAEGQESPQDTGGLRVFDLANPAQPVQAGRLDDGCGNAFDIAVDAGVSLAYLACGGGMQIIDIANPAQPRVVGRYDAGLQDSYTHVAQRGDRAWFSNGAGLHEIDVSDPTKPVRTKLTSVGHQGMNRLLSTDDGRLFALAGGAGVHVFSAPAARAVRDVANRPAPAAATRPTAASPAKRPAR